MQTVSMQVSARRFSTFYYLQPSVAGISLSGEIYKRQTFLRPRLVPQLEQILSKS
jgi:hypothetical protein